MQVVLIEPQNPFVHRAAFGIFTFTIFFPSIVHDSDLGRN